eukprot:TRINITY_DN4039_c0_g1_i1.p1 TRINITY_DN4039_c0_g1~~TRINITY_DN4039_c0_g1_i1.p1  ORF type:complete len:471 (-),score=145.97 TRINITY_DN4039_c0_g1_i1:26-1438(-)
MRLTADLISRSSTYWNPLKEREIDLRGNKIGVIENLGATQDQFDSFDLSDNELAKLENFPQLNRLRTLLLNNNKIEKISSTFGESLPHLETLVLTNNKLANFEDLEPLTSLYRLERLSLLDNLVTKKQHYRLYVIHKIPHLKQLDFRKIKKKERDASEKLYGKAEESRPSKKVKTEAKANGKETKSEDPHSHIKEAIKNAKTLEEIEQITKNQSRALQNHQKRTNGCVTTYRINNTHTQNKSSMTSPSSLKILVGGGSGFLGSRLVPQLKNRGHRVKIISRKGGQDKVTWDQIKRDGIEKDTDAVINLAGARILDWAWTDKRKQVLLDSRVGTTKLLVEKINSMKDGERPKVFINGSAVGIYPLDRVNTVDENYDGKVADNFAGELCKKWEDEVEKLNPSVRRVVTRFGIILGDGGALKPMSLLFKLGLGGKMASGQQFWPWIHIDDATGAITHFLEVSNQWTSFAILFT